VIRKFRKTPTVFKCENFFNLDQVSTSFRSLIVSQNVKKLNVL
jgi:hypothetical protein